jgi:hypothetical protein
VGLERRTSCTFTAGGTSRGGRTPHVPRVDVSDIRDEQTRQSTGVGAPGSADLRRVRTVLR